MHTFANKDKTADKWAVATKVTIAAGEETGAIEINAICQGCVNARSKTNREEKAGTDRRDNRRIVNAYAKRQEQTDEALAEIMLLIATGKEE